MPLYENQCIKCGSIFEILCSISDREKPRKCECGGKSKRLISAPNVKLEGLSGDFPGAAMKWEKQRMQRLRKEEKTLKDHGSL